MSMYLYGSDSLLEMFDVLGVSVGDQTGLSVNGPRLNLLEDVSPLAHRTLHKVLRYQLQIIYIYSGI